MTAAAREGWGREGDSWVEVLFPARILALSVDILVAGLRPPRASLLAGDAP
jgi:hypothetical protein